jgi:hypothetical protein
MSNENPELSGLASRVLALRRDLQQLSSTQLAEHTGAKFEGTNSGKGEFKLSIFEMPVRFTYPDFLGLGPNEEELPLHYQAVLTYYFLTSDGFPLSREWISFAELPDGRTYNQAFQGYSGDSLAKNFRLNLAAFRAACEKCGGSASTQGDAAYYFYALPRLPLLVNYWCGDEDFPSTCRILFDRNASHYLPTDVCAILGSMLTRKLLRGSAAKA